MVRLFDRLTLQCPFVTVPALLRSSLEGACFDVWKISIQPRNPITPFFRFCRTLRTALKSLFITAIQYRYLYSSSPLDPMDFRKVLRNAWFLEPAVLQ